MPRRQTGPATQLFRAGESGYVTDLGDQDRGEGRADAADLLDHPVAAVHRSPISWCASPGGLRRPRPAEGRRPTPARTHQLASVGKDFGEEVVALREDPAVGDLEEGQEGGGGEDGNELL